MSNNTTYLSTVEAAEALGVGVSTVKRWVDDGVLPAHRTAGGHRKLLKSEVLALARSGELPRRDLTGLVLKSSNKRRIEAEAIPPALQSALLNGNDGDARGLIHRVYSAGMPIETLADLAISPVMEKIGDQWACEEIDVWQEHRSTQACAAALYDLQADLQTRAERDRPVAVGGAPEGDPYLLSTLLAQLVLLDAGWEAVNLGPNTPFDSFLKAIHDLRPKLMWISVSYLEDPQRFLAEYKDFQQAVDRAGVPIAIGGQALSEPIRSQMLYTTYGDGLTHLSSFARTLHPRPKRPKRGRPKKT